VYRRLQHHLHQNHYKHHCRVKKDCRFHRYYLGLSLLAR
jgi:hypothetical protein